MGQRELFLGLFGALPGQSGEISVNGSTRRLGSPADAIAAGISLIPEERKTEGLLLDFDGKQNATLATLEQFSRSGLIDGVAEQDMVLRAFQQVNLASRATWAPVRHLSGGNQQKVIFAKWLMTGGRIMLLYDPTRGVDVGTKAEIYKIMRDFTATGGAALFYSTDITELVNLCDEVIVLYRGRIARVLGADEISETAIMQAAVGHAGGRTAA
ncbi:ATP-binding cassette domain-containing protein, partial [Aestuariivirga sp.]|uniref:ATP-binding cassette domain-containing protein n=1 Tax=Aestuariivirga sp. TaxID=2650926 RepID=UPI003017D4B3